VKIDPITGLKRCPKCKSWKLPEMFSKNRGQPDGLRTQCKACDGRTKRKYLSREDRFWKYFASRTARDEHGCLLWHGMAGKSGRPICQWNGSRTQVRRLVYRLSVGELPDDMFVFAFHMEGQRKVRCDLRCVNRLHLELGTEEDLRVHLANSSPTGDRHPSRLHPERLSRGDQHYARLHPERVARGERHGTHTHPERYRNAKDWMRERPERIPRGERHWAAKFTLDDIRTIRDLAEAGALQREIAERFRASQSTISAIVQRKAWTHIE
jgi:hypothetical protein